MRKVIITPPPGIGLKKSKSLSFVGKERFLKSVGVKNDHENMMKNKMEFRFSMEVRMKIRVFWGDSLKKNFEKNNSTVA